MTNVSFSKVSDASYKKAHRKMAELLYKHKDGGVNFIEELLTEAERVMLTKRFAAILAFSQDHSAYRVANVLSLSLSTAQRLREQYKEGQFSSMLSAFAPAERSGFLQLFMDLTTARASTAARARLMRRALKG